MKKDSIKYKLGLEGINFKPIFIIVTILSLIVSAFIDHKMPINFKFLTRISFLSLFIGVIIENYRITKNWRHVIYLTIFSYTLSLSWFLFNSSKKIEDYLYYWPYYFLLVFIFLSIALYSKKITQRINEGITLLFSLAFLYWLIDKNLFDLNNKFYILISTLFLIFILFSIFNSLTYVRLTDTYRLIMSVGTSLILLFISLDNAYKNIKNDYSVMYYQLTDHVFVFLRFFVLGISSVYIAQNINLLFTLLDKSSRRKAKRIYIEQYSDTQVKRQDSIFCIIFSLSIYFLNYYYKILPSSLVICFVVFTFPIILDLKFKILIFKKV